MGSGPVEGAVLFLHHVSDGVVSVIDGVANAEVGCIVDEARWDLTGKGGSFEEWRVVEAIEQHGQAAALGGSVFEGERRRGVVVEGEDGGAVGEETLGEVDVCRGHALHAHVVQEDLLDHVWEGTLHIKEEDSR